MSSDNSPTTEDEPASDHGQVDTDALADRVIDRMTERGDIDDGSLTGKVNRRDTLKAVGGGLLGAGLLGGASGGVAASLDGASGDQLAVGGSLNVDDSYHIAGAYFAGPKSARPASADDNAIWLVTDAGANYLTERTYWDGSSWQPLSVQTPAVNTEKLSNVAAFLDPSDSEADWQTTIDEVSAGGGGTVVPKPGTYLVDSSMLTVKSDVTLDGLSVGVATFKLADSTDSSRPSVIGVEPGATDWGIKNIEVDGNQANNPNATMELTQPHGIEVEDTANNNRPERGVLENIYSHDCVRSCVILAGKDIDARNLWLENSWKDHALYLARSVDSSVKNVWASGFFDRGAIVIGGNAYQTINNTVESVWIGNVSDPPGGSYNSSVEFQHQSDSDDYNNTLKDVTVDLTGYSEGVRLFIHQPDVTVEGYCQTGPVANTPIINMTNNAPRATVSDVRVDITQSNRGSTGYFCRMLGNDQTLEDYHFEVQDSTTDYRGVSLDGSSQVVERPSAENGYINVNGGVGFRLIGDTNAINHASIRDFTKESGGNVISASGTYNYEDGVMLPQDVTSIPSVYSGYMAYHDGTGTNTVGPAFNDAGWTSLVDGSSIS